MALLKPPHRVLVISGNNQGKCVAQGDIITLADGTRVKAGILAGKRFQLLTLVAGRAVSVTAMAEWNVCEPVYQLTTETGLRVVRNAAHPLWTADVRMGTGITPKPTNARWVPVAELQPGDLVAVADELPSWGEEEMADDEVKSLAYLIAEGGMTGGNFTFTQSAGTAQLAEFGECCNALGSRLKLQAGSEIDYRVVGADKSLRRKLVHPRGNATTHPINPVRDLASRHNITRKHCRDQRIPDAVFRLPREQQRLFLSRLYAGDGWACVSDGRCAEIGYASASERLARDVQAMLLRFGVHGTLMYKPGTNSWTVSAFAAGDIIRFADRIGIFAKETEVARVRALAASRTKDRQGWRLRGAHPGTRWERVKSIEVLPPEWTVAIEVPGRNTFLTSLWEHNTLLAGCLVNWYYDNYDPGICITTAPELRSVKETCWKEVRRLRGDRPGFIGDVVPEMRTSAWHYAKGYTVRVNGATSWQGRHDLDMLFLFEEAAGIPAPIWEATDTMHKADLGHFWLAILNPTTTTCRAYIEESLVRLDGSPKWRTFRLNALEHPNIAQQLRGEPPRIPSAATIEQVEDWISQWCEPVASGEEMETDFEWRPGSGQYYRPGPLGESRILGRWPSAGTYGVWSDALWQSVLARGELPGNDSVLPEIGCDVARFGDDWTCMHSRWGSVSLTHESHNGWPTPRTAQRLRELAANCAARVNAVRHKNAEPISPKAIPIRLDDDGIGGAVTDILRADGYAVIAVNGQSPTRNPGDYPNRRSELWFDGAGRARRKQMFLGRLPADVLARIRAQAMAPVYVVDERGRRVVEKKSETKKKIGRSPDDMDAVNLAYAEPTGFVAPNLPPEPARTTLEDRLRSGESAADRRGMFGLGGRR